MKMNILVKVIFYSTSYFLKSYEKHLLKETTKLKLKNVIRISTKIIHTLSEFKTTLLNNSLISCRKKRLITYEICTSYFLKLLKSNEMASPPFVKVLIILNS